MFRKWFSLDKTNRRGFTLVEIMAGVAIIGLISAVAIPVYVTQQNQASQGEAVSDGTSWYVAISTKLSGYSSLGSSPASNTTAITLNGSTIRVTMTNPTPSSPATLDIPVTSASQTVIQTSGIRSDGWCFQTSNNDQVAVFTEDGYIEEGLSCTSSGWVNTDTTALSGGDCGNTTCDLFTAPDAPINLSADTNGVNANIKPDRLTWTAPTCPTGFTPEYNIQLTTKNGVAGAFDTTGMTVTGTSFNIPSAWVLNGASYGYKIQARCNSTTNGTSATSNWSSEYKFVTTPTVPTGLVSNSAGTLSIKPDRLQWNAVTCTAGSPQYNVIETMDAGVTVSSNWQNSGWISTNSFNIPADWLVAAKNYGYKVQARCNGAAGTSPGTAYSSETTFSTNPVAPSNLSASNGGTAPYAPNALTWTANTCGTGYTPQYYILMVNKQGVAGTFDNSGWLSNVSSYTIPASWLSDGNTFGFQIKSRCYSAAYTSPESAYSATFTMNTQSYTPNGLTSNNSGTTVTGVTNNRLIWNDITCPTGYSPEYYVNRTSFKGGAADNVNSGWVTGTDSGAQTYYDIQASWNHHQGATYSYTVQGRCTGAGGTSSSSAPSVATTFTTGINAPAAPTGVTNNGWATISWAAVTCPTGTTPSYRMYQSTTNGGATSTLRMDWSTSRSADISGSGGYAQAGYAQARCDGANASSAASANSAVTSWTKSVSGVYSMDIYISSWRVASWYANCGEGSPRYRAKIVAAWGTYDSGYWTTGTSYSNTGSGWGVGSLELWAYCVQNNVGSGSSYIVYNPGFGV